jgi:hypothetical protein
MQRACDRLLCTSTRQSITQRGQRRPDGTPNATHTRWRCSGWVVAQAALRNHAIVQHIVQTAPDTPNATAVAHRKQVGGMGSNDQQRRV